MYAFSFEGKRYDIGDKLGFLQATAEFALNREDIRNDFIHYLEKVVQDYGGTRIGFVTSEREEIAATGNYKIIGPYNVWAEFLFT
jgi:UTP--glucose-1-phosphate uridylyltransferase